MFGKNIFVKMSGMFSVIVYSCIKILRNALPQNEPLRPYTWKERPKVKPPLFYTAYCNDCSWHKCEHSAMRRRFSTHLEGVCKATETNRPELQYANRPTKLTNRQFNFVHSVRCVRAFIGMA